ncbi:MAG: hypothetical protein ACYTCU_11035, partial [Planctomycetota bacterium]
MGMFDKLFGKKPAPTRPGPRPGPRPGAVARGEPKAKNNYIVITLDSCRYDSFMEAPHDNIAKISGGKVERRWSYASWTGPSH